VTRARGALLVLGATVRIGGSEVEITRRGGTDGRPIVRLSGCDDREAAALLRGQELMVPRGAAPPLEEDEWWAEDLEGCSVHDAGRSVGTVARLLALPSCEVLEVVRSDHENPLLVPLVRDAVRSVDIEHRAIDVDLAFLGEDV
jgi:16S rRNA processing protein RimM